MTLAPHTIAPPHGAKKAVRRLGRGHGTGRGKSAGRGTKGQRARTGGKSRTAVRAFKRELQKIPKSRGFKSFYEKPIVVTLATLERVSAAGDVVNLAYLVKKGLVRPTRSRGVKVLATGMLTKKITLQGCLASKSAVSAIEKAGGKVVF